MSFWNNYLKNDATIDSLYSIEFVKNFQSMNILQVSQLFQAFESYPDHYRLLVTSYSWDIYDHLFNLYQDEITENDKIILNKFIHLVFWHLPVREIEIMVLEKFAVSQTANQYSFLLVSVASSFQLVAKLFPSKSDVMSIDYLLKVLSSLLKKLVELLQLEGNSIKSFKFQILTEIPNMVKEILTHYRFASKVSFDNKMKGIFTGFLLQVMVKGVFGLTNYEERKKLSKTFSILLLTEIWENDTIILFHHIPREIFRVIRSLRRERKDERFYRLWTNEKDQQNQKKLELSIFKGMNNEQLAAAFAYLQEVGESKEDIWSAVHLSDDFLLTFHEKSCSSDFIHYFDCIHKKEHVIVSTLFPWSCSALSLLLFTVIEDYFNPSDSSSLLIKPYNASYLLPILQRCLIYLFETPALQSFEGLSAFNLLYTQSTQSGTSRRLDRQYFLPYWVVMNSSTKPQDRNESVSRLLAIVDDDLQMIFNPSGVERSEHFQSRTLWKTVHQSNLHWKLSQMIITCIVSCPNAQLREKSYYNLRQYFQQFESKSRFLLIMSLSEHCPYSQMKALLIDSLKAICQQSITTIVREQLSSVHVELDIVNRGNNTVFKMWKAMNLKFPKSAPNYEDYDFFIQTIADNDDNWRFDIDYTTIINRQTSHGLIDNSIYQSRLNHYDEVFWSEKMIKRLFYGEKGDITKLRFEEMVESGEYYNAKINLLYFLLIKLEYSLKEYLLVRLNNGSKPSFQAKSQAPELQRMMLIWGIFFELILLNQSDHSPPQALNVPELLSKGVKLFEELLVYLQTWWREGQKMFIENQTKNNGSKVDEEEGKEDTSLPAEELVRVDLLLSNISRCIEKLRLLYIQLYIYYLTNEYSP